MGMCAQVFTKSKVFIFRTPVPQVFVSPIFSLQIYPLPDVSTLVDDPIIMRFDVVS